MMHPIRLIPGLLFLLVFSFQALRAQSVASAPEALAWNDRLTAITDSLFLKGHAWSMQLNESNSSGNYGPLRPLRESLARYVDASMGQVSGMAKPRNSDALRKTMIRFLEWERDMIGAAFRPLEDLDKAAGTAARQAAIAKLGAYFSSEALELEKLHAAQESFVRSYGYTTVRTGPGKADKR